MDDGTELGVAPLLAPPCWPPTGPPLLAPHGVPPLLAPPPVGPPRPDLGFIQDLDRLGGFFFGI